MFMEGKQSLVDFLYSIPDKRRGEGKRHDQTFILLTVIMSTMSGYNGYRATGDFIERNATDLLRHFAPPKGRLPSFYTVRRVVQGLDYNVLSQKFYQWAVQNTCLEEREWVSIDGKAIRGAATNYNDDKQRFINLVSLYCSKQKLVLGNALVDNSKENEIPVVQQLIAALDIKGVTFTLDALHCQKKLQPQLLRAETIT
jgi:hypothetical protein